MNIKDFEVGELVQLVDPPPTRPDRGWKSDHAAHNAIGLVTKDHYTSPHWVPILMPNPDGPGLVRRYVAVNLEVKRHRNAALKRQISKLEWTFNLYAAPGRNVNSTGADPEVFVVDKHQQVIPATDFLPNKKDAGTDRPFYDGFQAEFRVFQGGCHEQRIAHIWSALHHLEHLAKRHSPGAKLISNETMDVSPLLLAEGPRHLVQLLCNPSINAYKAAPPAIPPGPELPFRTAGFHIHFSGYKGRGYLSLKTNAARLVRLMDLMAGISSVALFAGLEDPRRRLVYGRAGEYRLPTHGLEYRTLSSRALMHPTLTYLMFDMTRFVINNHEVLTKELHNPGDEVVQEIINNCNVDAARIHVKKNAVLFNAFLQKAYATNSSKALELFMKGASQFFDENMHANWKLAGYEATGGMTAYSWFRNNMERL